MRAVVSVVLCLIFSLCVSPLRAAQVVLVGGYDFPPFVESQREARPALVPQMIDALNKMQSDWRFEFVPVAARRRYGDLSQGRFDVMFFESPSWGWQNHPDALFTKVFMTGGEVYVALAQPGRTQAYFDTLEGKSLVGILGYHYGFAGFDADPEALARRFDIKLVSSHRSSIDLVLSGRRDVAVVTDSYLSLYLRDTPQAQGRLLVSDRLDQDYQHRVLLRRGGPLGVADMERLLDQLRQSGELNVILRGSGVSK